MQLQGPRTDRSTTELLPACSRASQGSQSTQLQLHCVTLHPSPPLQQSALCCSPRCSHHRYSPRCSRRCCCCAHMLSVTESEPTSSGGSALATALRASADTCTHAAATAAGRADDRANVNTPAAERRVPGHIRKPRALPVATASGLRCALVCTRDRKTPQSADYADCRLTSLQQPAHRILLHSSTGPAAPCTHQLAALPSPYIIQHKSQLAMLWLQG